MGYVNYVICEDDKKRLDHIVQHLNKLSIHSGCITTFSGNELLSHLLEIKENTIFLIDVMLSDINGVQLAKAINQRLRCTAIIFFSPCLESITHIYETKHCYFIYMPEIQKHLPRALQRAQAYIEQHQNVMWVKIQHKTIQRLEESEIYYIERIKRTTYIHYTNQVFECTQNIQYFQEHLSSSFLQCHRSFLINLDHVIEYRRTNIRMKNNQIIPISRAFQSEMKTIFHGVVLG